MWRRQVWEILEEARKVQDRDRLVHFLLPIVEAAMELDIENIIRERTYLPEFDTQYKKLVKLGEAVTEAKISNWGDNK